MFLWFPMGTTLQLTFCRTTAPAVGLGEVIAAAILKGVLTWSSKTESSSSLGIQKVSINGFHQWLILGTFG